MNDNEKLFMKQIIIDNQHEICIISLEEWNLRLEGYLSENTKLKNKLHDWNQLKGPAEFLANWYATGDDLVKLGVLIRDLGGSGEFYIKEYAGKSHLILKGYPGLRSILTGTKYGVANPTIIKMGLGKLGAASATRSGGIVSILLVSVYRITDYVLSDEQTLTHLIGSLATDVVKVGIATTASIAAGAFAASITTLAIGPLAVAIVVGGLVAWGLGKVDEHFGITEKVIEELDEINNSFSRIFDQFLYEWNYLERNPHLLPCIFGGPCYSRY